MDNLSLKFKEKKLKLTPQRIAIYEYLLSTKEHPSAETIYKAIKKNYPTMSLATVYKTLKTLADIDLIQELNLGEYNFRYDANINPHPHIKCIKCGRVDDIDNLTFNSLNSKARKYTDYKIYFNQVYFFGVCKECQNK